METLRKELDELISEFGKLVLEDEKETTVISGQRRAQLEFIYECMRFLTRGSGAKVSYKLYKPVKTMGYVTVEGRSIDIVNTEWFARAISVSSNIEVYPLVDGRIRMELCVHGLTAPIMEGNK